MNTIDIIIKGIASGAHTIIPHEDLVKKLASGKPLVIKLGADPTAAHLHLGHAVVLLKMRQLQDMGHKIIFLIGDFTARIGDPTGKSKTRLPITEDEIAHNTKTYIDQVSRVLDKSRLVVRYNSEWLDVLTSREWIKLCAQVTVARIIERDDFAKRLENKQPIGMHELLYPLVQAYDSVELKADIELGGTDQTFNLLMGRHLQEQLGLEPQVVITVPLLVGLDGSMKMSKSLKNDIGLTDSPDQVFGKIMSLSDDAMWQYYQLLLWTDDEEIKKMQMSIADGSLHPMHCKKQLAYAILKKLWSEADAIVGQAAFENTFEKRNYDSAIIIECAGKNFVTLVDFMVFLDATLSRTQARRLIADGAVMIHGKKMVDQFASYIAVSGDTIRVGKQKRYQVA